MPIELKIPEVGESIVEVEIGDWLRKEGEQVAKDEPVVSLESEKATVELPSPDSGRISQILKQKGETAQVGEVIGYLEKDGKESAARNKEPEAGTQKPEQRSKKEEPKPSARSSQQDAAQSGRAEPEGKTGKKSVSENVESTRAKTASSPLPSPPAPKAFGVQAERERGSQTRSAQPERRVMPAAERALAERGFRVEEIEPTGPGGRVLKEDVLRKPEPPERAPVGRAEAPTVASGRPSKPVGREEEVVPMSRLRRTVAERLVAAQHAAALLTTFNEVDMTNVMALRKQYGEEFQQKYNVKLGFMSFFVKASIDALKQFPGVNAEVRDTNIIYHNYFDIGVAIGGGKGLVVPVLRNAERMSFAEIEVAIGDFARRAKENKLKVEELQGGTFTISNGGIYGSLLSTPIVNPPQSGVLGMHAIQERPVAREGNVVIRPMMYLALTYDHRIVDGREAVTFLKRIKEVIENPARMLMEV